MGASIVAYWPGITERQPKRNQASGMTTAHGGSAEREDDMAVSDAIRKLHAEAILTFKTDG